ncbi:unnamed protein product [Nesidiocoris tenuis]|uniref:Uncharacterized protein n=1 Tax=Nesidiocoris tenuis TaxID=355587 RepID=A0A6H5GES2_9HEMI|nr:unnamed protein product [Nesidiocoris tenuis]
MMWFQQDGATFSYRSHCVGGRKVSKPCHLGDVGTSTHTYDKYSNSNDDFSLLRCSRYSSEILFWDIFASAGVFNFHIYRSVARSGSTSSRRSESRLPPQTCGRFDFFSAGLEVKCAVLVPGIRDRLAVVVHVMMRHCIY